MTCLSRMETSSASTAGWSFRGYYGDAARTYRVGAVSEQAARLLEVTRRALDVALDCVAPGRWLHDIGRAVERYVKDRGFSVVRDFVGHGIGSALHEEPEVPNYRRRGSWHRVAVRHGVGDRADGQRRKPGREDGWRRLDGENEGWIVVGSLRALGRGDGGRSARTGLGGLNQRGSKRAKGYWA